MAAHATQMTIDRFMPKSSGGRKRRRSRTKIRIAQSLFAEEGDCGRFFYTHNIEQAADCRHHNQVQRTARFNI
jgi:hypothetical protein